jgi:hypothetical protein
MTRRGVNRPRPTRACQVNDRPSTVCSAVKGSQTPTLMCPLIVMQAPPGSEAPSRIAWLK